MFDLSLLIARLQKTIKVPEDFTLPLSHSTSGIYDKSEFNKRVYHNFECQFSLGSVIEIYQYTQKQFLVESLTWADEQYSKGQIPLAAYSLRTFMESSANYHEGIEKIETAYSVHNSIKTNLINKTNLIEKYDELLISLKKNHYDLVIKLILPTTLRLDNDHAKPNSLLIEEEWEKNITEIKGFSNSNYEFNDNNSISNTKGALLKPNNVITNLKKLEKNVLGIHPAYDLLSEFVHPNSYPLSSRINQFENTDDVSRPIVVWKFNEIARPTTSQPFDNIATVIHNCTNEILLKDQVLHKLSNKIKREIKQYVRPFIKHSGLAEDARYGKTLCLCGSKKKLMSCCGRIHS